MYEKLIDTFKTVIGGIIILIKKLVNEISQFKKNLQSFFQWLTKGSKILLNNSTIINYYFIFKAQFTFQGENGGKWKPLNNAIIDEGKIASFIDNGLSCPIITEILSQDDTHNLRKDSTNNFEESKLPFRDSQFASIFGALSHTNQLYDEVFQYPSQTCTESFNYCNSIKLPKVIRYDIHLFIKNFEKVKLMYILNSEGNISVQFQNQYDSDSELNYLLTGFLCNDSNDIHGMQNSNFKFISIQN